MSIQVFVHSERLADSDLKWAVSHTNGLLQFWSQLDNISTQYSGCVPEQLVLLKFNLYLNKIMVT